MSTELHIEIKRDPERQPSWTDVDEIVQKVAAQCFREGYEAALADMRKVLPEERCQWQ